VPLDCVLFLLSALVWAAVLRLLHPRMQLLTVAAAWTLGMLAHTVTAVLCLPAGAHLPACLPDCCPATAPPLPAAQATR
jgi:hypothetical protein